MQKIIVITLMKSWANFVWIWPSGSRESSYSSPVTTMTPSHDDIESVTSCSPGAGPLAFPLELTDISLEFKTPSETRGLPFFVNHRYFVSGQSPEPEGEDRARQTHESAGGARQEPQGERTGRQVPAPRAQAGRCSPSRGLGEHRQTTWGANSLRFRLFSRAFFFVSVWLADTHSHTWLEYYFLRYQGSFIVETRWNIIKKTVMMCHLKRPREGK